MYAVGRKTEVLSTEFRVLKLALSLSTQYSALITIF